MRLWILSCVINYINERQSENKQDTWSLQGLGNSEHGSPLLPQRNVHAENKPIKMRRKTAKAFFGLNSQFYYGLYLHSSEISICDGVRGSSAPSRGILHICKGTVNAEWRAAVQIKSFITDGLANYYQLIINIKPPCAHTGSSLCPL